jgi:Dolichyl-phosphate-mannose-protein mannosyltransferase
MIGARTRTEDAPSGEVVRVPDAEQPWWRRWAIPAALIAIVIVALFVRVIHLTALGFNSDEAVYTGQAGALAGVGDYARNFSPFRAHPLLLQAILAMEIVLLNRASEFVSRLTVVLAGLGAVYMTYRLGRKLYGSVVGLIAAFALAIVPYHVFISRQVLLDVPAGLAVLLAFAALYRYEGYETRRLLYLAGALAGIACVTKETMIIFGPAALLYLAWAGLLKKTRFRDGVIALVLMLVPLLPFISTRFFFSGSSSSGYIIYQVFREPNHPFWYFPVVFWIFITPVATLAIAYGIFIAAARRTRGDKLLLSWLIVFGAFFQFWPTKLLPYAIILLPAMVLLGSRGVVDAVRRIRARWPAGLTTAVAAAVALAVFVPMLGPAWRAGDVIRDSSFSGPLTTDVEVQDFAGGREVGTWFSEHTPTNTTVLTMGPSLGNLVSFYGDRDFYALSVSRDPKLRNPAYRPILNPDSEIRQMHVQYAVWDAYTADRSPFYSQQLMAYQEKYSGTPVFSVWVDGNDVSTTRGAPPPFAEVRIIVYALVGGDPLRDVRMGGGP